MTLQEARKDIGKKCKFWNEEDEGFVVGHLTYADEEDLGYIIYQCDGWFWYKNRKVIE